MARTLSLGASLEVLRLGLKTKQSNFQVERPTFWHGKVLVQDVSFPPLSENIRSLIEAILVCGGIYFIEHSKPARKFLERLSSVRDLLRIEKNAF